MAKFLGNILTQVRGLALTAPWLVYLLMADVLLSLLLPFKLLFPNTVYHLSSRIAGSVWRWIQQIFETSNGAVITTSGDVLPEGESAVVVANHVGWSDFYMIQALAIRAGMLHRCRWFAKIQLRMVPFLGWGLWAMGMPLVSRNWLKDKVELDRVFSGITERRWPTCRLPSSTHPWFGIQALIIVRS
jgi:1-acyl-sn-glycerol-3-phosphate acyltransferase